jgi:hypothetical protein
VETIENREIELLGEEGARATVSFDDGSWYPDRAGMQMSLYNGSNSSKFYLDLEEAIQLQAMIAAQIPRRKFGGKGVTFEGRAGHSVAFYPDNMGEPFREGMSIYHRAGDDHPGIHVFLKNAVATILGNAIRTALVDPSPRPTM